MRYPSNIVSNKPMATKHPIDNRPVRKMATRNCDGQIVLMALVLFGGSLITMWVW